MMDEGRWKKEDQKSRRSESWQIELARESNLLTFLTSHLLAVNPLNFLLLTGAVIKKRAKYENISNNHLYFGNDVGNGECGECGFILSG